MIIQKITPGFVVQNFDTDLNRFVSQEFVAGDETDWEYNGEKITPPDQCVTHQLLFIMVQPRILY